MSRAEGEPDSIFNPHNAFEGPMPAGRSGARGESGAPERFGYPLLNVVIRLAA